MIRATSPVLTKADFPAERRQSAPRVVVGPLLWRIRLLHAGTSSRDFTAGHGMCTSCDSMSILSTTTTSCEEPCHHEANR